MPLPIREEELDHIAKKVYALYARHGFDKISMDEICRQTNISKATLYRYFTSKEDIVRQMTDLIISHLDSVSFSETENIRDVIDGLRGFYIKSIFITSLSGSEFLNDLKNKFPDCYDSYISAKNTIQERFSDFYMNSVKKGHFKDLPFVFVNRQFTDMLPVITDMDYLDENKMMLKDALREYYRMFLYQILAQDYLFIADNRETYDFVEELADVLHSDFFIDSIRR